MVIGVGSVTRAVFKWLSKVIKWLRWLRLVIGLKESRQFFNQWEAKPKPIAPCTRDFSGALSELQVIARNCDWFIVLFVPVVIGRSNCFAFSFSTVIWKPLYCIVCDNYWNLFGQLFKKIKKKILWHHMVSYARRPLYPKNFICYRLRLASGRHVQTNTLRSKNRIVVGHWKPHNFL